MIRALVVCLSLVMMPLGLAKELTPEEVKAVKADITKFMGVFNEGDPTELLKVTHESIYELAGGKEAFEEMTKAVMAELMKTGIKMEKTEIGKPTKLHPAGEYELCFVPMKTVMSVQETRVEATGFMIAIRTVGKETWKYLDGSGLRTNPGMLKQLFPKLAEGLKTPPQEVKVLEPEVEEEPAAEAE